MQHYHCYKWLGSATDFRNEFQRRPASPQFTTSLVTPMRTCDWLLKPAHQCDLETTDMNAVVDWLETWYTDLEPSFARPDQEAKIGLDFRIDIAISTLPGGVDLQWGFWLNSGNYATIAVVRCPNVFAPNYPCPSRQVVGRN